MKGTVNVITVTVFDLDPEKLSEHGAREARLITKGRRGAVGSASDSSDS